MLSLIEQIRSGALWDFPGGIHPAENKKQSNQTAIVHASLPDEIVLPLKQHIGKAGQLLVKTGDHVQKGQPLTESDSSFSLPVHASTSGTIVAIEPRTIAHPSGLSEPCVVIKPDGLETWFAKTPLSDYTRHEADSLIDIIRQAGISGMGGAGFPTAKKIQSGLARTDILIVNAAECEPYITADDVLLQHYAAEVISGINIVEHILKPKLTVIAIEDNKPQAIAALQAACQGKDIVIRVIPTKYPSGGEKQLIKIVTNQEVPAGGIPADIGVLVQNVASLYAIKRAVINGEPMLERIVTLTGKTFKQPRNVWALLGTPVQSLLTEFGYKEDRKLPRLIMGGPMMGFSLPHSHVPITKTANCILAPKRHEIEANSYELECIRCGQCADVCPASLLPQQLQWYAKAEDYDKCEEFNLKDCIECGACAFVCPSKIPLVNYYRQAKAEIRTRHAEAQASERAKERFEEKKARMERDKAEREQRFKQAAQTRRSEMKDSSGSDAIAAAIERVKSKQQVASESSAVKPAVAAAIARAKQKQAQAAQAGASQPDNSEMSKLREERKRQARERKAQLQTEHADTQDDKKASVAAAIARAKARKAEKEQAKPAEDATPQAPADDKKAAVAAAIARAKARQAEKEQAKPAEVTPQAPADDKKAAVAAAIARAKARQAEKEQAKPAADATPQAPADDKKAAVAAAIARAKARKAEKEQAKPEEDAAPQAPADDKKAAVAAAIARAKARKAEKEQAKPAEVTPQSPADDKKAAVAAAIARAKARKAEKENKTMPSSDHEENK